MAARLSQVRLVQNLLLLLASVTFILLAAEAAVRLVHSHKAGKTLEDARAAGVLGGDEKSRQIRAGFSVGLAHLIMPSANPKIIYELMPGVSAHSHGVWIRTNSHGFRDREYPLNKPPGTVRIVGIGDSVMYGQGVASGDVYLSILENRLNDTHEMNFEIINMAVPGYNTVMEVETLRDKGLVFSPDIVILGFVGNDYCLPNFIRRKFDYFSLRQSFLYELIAERGRIMLAPEGSLKQLGSLHEANVNLCKEQEAPDEYASIVGKTAVLNAFDELAALEKRHGFHVVVAFWGPPENDLLAASREHGFHIFETQRKLEDYMHEHGIEAYMGSRLSLNESDPHPSTVTHRLIAGWLQDFMEEDDVVRPHE